MGNETIGGLILCGGKSSRMGHDKAHLRFGARSLLTLAVERMGQVAEPVAVSLAAGMTPGPLPPEVLLARDEQPGRGPLWGLLEGFRLLNGRADGVVVMPVDMPFFTADWMARLRDGLADHAACLTRWEGVTNALCAAYRLSLLPKVEALVAAGRMRPLFISEGEAAAVLGVEEHWRPAEGPPPLMDVDTPEAYAEALLLGGFGDPAAPAVTVTLGLRAGAAAQLPAPPAPLPLHAATAGDALELVRRLYPELAQAGGAARLFAEGREEAMAGATPLQPGARLEVELRRIE